MTMLPMNQAPMATMPSLDHTPIVPPIWQLGQSLDPGLIREFACFTKVLAHLALALAFFETISALRVLHPSNSYSLCLDSLMNFQLDVNLELFSSSFKLAFLCLSHLLAGSPSSIFEIFSSENIQEVVSFSSTNWVPCGDRPYLKVYCLDSWC